MRLSLSRLSLYCRAPSMIVVDRARHALADHQHVGLIMESNPGFHDPGPKPTTYVGFSPGSWKPRLAWSEATTARRFPPPLPQRRHPGGTATRYSAAGQPHPPGHPISGERAQMFAIPIRRTLPCRVEGCAPVVPYSSHGRALPFRYAQGGGASVTRKRPVTVVLVPGSSAYILVAKCRCDIGISGTATAIRLTLPAAQGAVFTGREAVGAASPDLSYCRGGRADPGPAPP